MPGVGNVTNNQGYTRLPKELPHDLNSKPSGTSHGTSHGTQNHESVEQGKDSPQSLQYQNHAPDSSDNPQKQNFFQKLSTKQKVGIAVGVALAGGLYLGSRPAEPKANSSSGQRT